MSSNKITLGFGLLLLCTALITQAFAKPEYPGLQPAAYNNNSAFSSCLACHSSASPATENNANTTYGLLFGNASDDDDDGEISAAYLTLEPIDIDRDGFSNGQELRQATGDFNSDANTPTLAAAEKIAGTVSAQSVDGGAVSALSITGTSFADDITTFEKPASGVTSTSASFMYTFGGMQSLATGVFYDENNAVIASTPTNTADGTFTPNLITGDTTLDGSMKVLVKDEGVFDLYSEAAFIRIAKARTPAFTPVANPVAINTNATISASAKISPTATINNNAVIEAFAIVDDNAVVGVYAQVGSYAHIATGVTLAAGTSASKVIIDPYVEVTANVAAVPAQISLPVSVGHVKASFSITTTAPAFPSTTGVGDEFDDDDNDNDDGGSGGLHCMTSNLGIQGLMFFGLFALTYFIRRRKS